VENNLNFSSCSLLTHVEKLSASVQLN